MRLEPSGKPGNNSWSGMAGPVLQVVPSKVLVCQEGCHATITPIKNVPNPFPENHPETLTGSGCLNLELGQRRAQAVVDYMVSAGIKAERLTARSKGETDPAVRNDSPANRALNRRVAFEVTVRN